MRRRVLDGLLVGGDDGHRALHALGNLLPDIKGIYRRDYSKHMGYGDHNQETAIDGVLLTHAHVDHCAYIHYLRPEIPIHCSEASALIMQGFQDMGSDEEYITYKENFKIYISHILSIQDKRRGTRLPGPNDGHGVPLRHEGKVSNP